MKNYNVKYTDYEYDDAHAFEAWKVKPILIISFLVYAVILGCIQPENALFFLRVVIYMTYIPIFIMAPSYICIRNRKGFLDRYEYRVPNDKTIARCAIWIFAWLAIMLGIFCSTEYEKKYGYQEQYTYSVESVDDTFELGNKPECNNFHELASYYAGKPVTHEVGGQYSSFHAMSQHYNNLGGAR